MGTHTQGVALGWHVPRRWRSNLPAVRTAITWPGEVRMKQSELRRLRLRPGGNRAPGQKTTSRSARKPRSAEKTALPAGGRGRSAEKTSLPHASNRHFPDKTGFRRPSKRHFPGKMLIRPRRIAILPPERPFDAVGLAFCRQNPHSPPSKRRSAGKMGIRRRGKRPPADGFRVQAIAIEPVALKLMLLPQQGTEIRKRSPPQPPFGHP